MQAKLMGLGVLLSLAVCAKAQSRGLEGNWRNPTGSITKVYGCGDAVCLKIMQVERSAPGTVDANNPDAKLRSRSLCGLEIGKGFKPQESRLKADGGTLYDPKSGKTYTGALTANGDLLKLRGYLGFMVFGRTEEWTRVSGPVDVCHA